MSALTEDGVTTYTCDADACSVEATGPPPPRWWFLTQEHDPEEEALPAEERTTLLTVLHFDTLEHLQTYVEAMT